MNDNEAMQWIRVVLSKISLLEDKKGINILEKCGRECAISHGFPDGAKKIRNEIDDKNNIDLLFTRFKEKVYDNSPRLYKEGDIMYLEYHTCACPIVNSGKITNPFFCHCTCGYTKEIFEELFDKFVKVDVLQSILKGDEICKQAITIVNDTEQWMSVALSEISLLEDEKGINILEKCGRECAKSHELSDEAKRIRNEVDDKKNTDLLFTRYKEKVFNNSPRLYKEGNVMYLEYHKCGCPLVNSGEVTHPFFCHCTRGYTKERFEALFDKPVHVDLIASILRRDKICKQAITIAEE